MIMCLGLRGVVSLKALSASVNKSRLVCVFMTVWNSGVGNLSGATPLGQGGKTQWSPRRVGGTHCRARLGTRIYHFLVFSLICFPSLSSLFSHPSLGLEAYEGREDPKKAL